MGLGDMFEAKKRVEDLVSDPETKAALNTIIHEAKKEIDSAAKNPNLKSGSLREAFNTASKLADISEGFVNTKKIPKLKLLGMRKELDRMGQRFERAYNENDPILLGILDSFGKNAKVQDATVKLAAANENAIKLEADGNGGGALKLDLLPGQTITVPMEPEAFAQAQEIIAKAKQKKQGPGPSA
jgi:hypothetical protein